MAAGGGQEEEEEEVMLYSKAFHGISAGLVSLALWDCSKVVIELRVACCVLSVD